MKAERKKGNERGWTDDWNLQHWKMMDNIAGVEIAGLDNDRLRRSRK